MIRPPPRSPLFPSPTLSRSALTPSSSAASLIRNTVTRPAYPPQLPGEIDDPASIFRGSGHPGARTAEDASRIRSEEHTSELQSPCNLVCRLLLEKKKKNHQLSVRVERMNINRAPHEYTHRLNTVHHNSRLPTYGYVTHDVSRPLRS